jgi:hypothetical protein
MSDRLAFDLFAGTGSATKALKARGWTVVEVESDPSFGPDLLADVGTLTAAGLIERYGSPDFVWASPPCTAFSVASLGHHWTGGHRAYIPRTDKARESVTLVAHTVALIEALSPRLGWIMENPRGLLRKLPVVAGLPRSTVTYCQFGDNRMKPTDLWGGIEGWLPDARCKNGDACHVAAPRGARTGTQGLKGARDRSMVPLGLSVAVANRLDDADRRGR